MSNRDFLAYGYLHSADFDENTITFKIDGDIPPLTRGRFAIAGFDKFSSAVRAADLWHKSQKKERTDA